MRLGAWKFGNGKFKARRESRFLFFVVERKRKKKQQLSLPHSKSLLRRCCKVATRRQPLQRRELADPGAGKDYVVRVNNGGLAWGYRALGRIKRDAGARVGKGLDGGGCGFMFVANFHRRTDGL